LISRNIFWWELISCFPLCVIVLLSRFFAKIPLNRHSTKKSKCKLISRNIFSVPINICIFNSTAVISSLCCNTSAFFSSYILGIVRLCERALSFHLSKAENSREEVEGYVVVRFERERSLLQRTIRGLRGRLRRPLPLQLLHTRKYTTVGDCKAAKTDQCVKKDLSIRKRIRYRNKIMCIWWFDEKSWRLKAVSAWYWNIANTY